MEKFIPFQYIPSKLFSNDFKVKLFVSHKWFDKDQVDNKDNEMIKCIKFSLIMLLYSVIRPRYLRMCFGNRDDCMIVSKSTTKKILELMDPGLVDVIPNEDYLKLWDELFGTNYGVVLSGDITGLFQIMSKIGVWIDYCCIPQRPFKNVNEENLFNEELFKINSYICDSETLCVWTGEEYHRGWCLFELMAGIKTNTLSFISAKEVINMKQWFQDGYLDMKKHITERVSDFHERLSYNRLDPFEMGLLIGARIHGKNINDLIAKEMNYIGIFPKTTFIDTMMREIKKIKDIEQTINKFNDSKQILNYFSENRINCTNKSDLQILSSKLFKFPNYLEINEVCCCVCYDDQITQNNSNSFTYRNTEAESNKWLCRIS